MAIKQWIFNQRLPLALIGLMVMTRFHHFGDTLHLPDASLAVFFFAGFYRHKLLLAFLLVLAGLIDYAAISQDTSSVCISPAYLFLLPTYAVMWQAGRYCCALPSGAAVTRLARAAGLLCLATTAAFAISNSSFYWFSGNFAEMTFAQYFAATVRYFPSYLLATVTYGILGWLVSRLLKTTTEAAVYNGSADIH